MNDQKYGLTVEADVALSLNGLMTGWEYEATDIYERYCAYVRKQGNVPGHPVAVGQILRRLGCERRIATIGGGGRGYPGRGRTVRVWKIK